MTIDDWLSRLPRRDWLGWSLCLAVIALAVLLRLALPLAGAFITFYPAILAYWAGLTFGSELLQD